MLYNPAPLQQCSDQQVHTILLCHLPGLEVSNRTEPAESDPGLAGRAADVGGVAEHWGWNTQCGSNSQTPGELLESLLFVFPDVSIKRGVIKHYSNWVME